MQIFEDDETVSHIYQRALSLTISKEFSEQYNGKILFTAQQGSEQTQPRRELLAVEKQAKQEKIIEAHGQNHFRSQVMNQFFAEVNTQINTEFDNKEHLYKNVLHIEDAAPSILEILSLKAASVNRITPLASSLPWLTHDLIKLVNKPQYRKRADVQVSKINLALSYIGLDNLKLLMPTFILKHWLPLSTAPYPLMKRKLWNDSLAIALAAKVLAEQEKLDSFTAFSCGMFANIGHLAVTRCVLQSYNKTHKAKLRETYTNRDKRLHDIFLQLDIAPELLLEQLIHRGSKITADLVDLMRFDRLTITEPLFDMAYSYDLNKMHPIAKIVTKARAYIAVRSLTKEDLITEDETAHFFNKVDLTDRDIKLLKKSDIDHIKLNFK